MKRAFAFSCCCALFACQFAAIRGTEPPAVTLSVPATVVDGANPGIRVAGLRANEVVRIHMLRSLGKWKNEGGSWKQVRQSLHAYADFAASADGTVGVDTQAPTQGTYTQADPLALLRTGYRVSDPALKTVRAFAEEPLAAGPESRMWVKLERDGKVAAEASFDIIDSVEKLEIAEKFGDGWHAVLAFPVGAKHLPVVLSLHGSEGGSVGKARGRAVPFAAQGFAAVAINYFAYPHEAIKGIPTKHSEIKLEILESVRDWLKTRPEMDVSRLHLVGASKGAEFALLAATKFDWITSVVAVVPSDIVWEGYGYADASGRDGTATSSWSFGGKPMPFVPLFPFNPKQEGMYRTNTERYERSRKFHADREKAACIPVEDAKARFLLLASDRDEVWASGAMARSLVERMESAGKTNRLEVKIYPKAGHQITGTGTFPVRIYGEQSSDPDAKDILAEGAASADAWRVTLKFLKR